MTTAFGYEDRASPRGVSRLSLGIALAAIGVFLGAAVIALFVVQPSQAITEQSFGGSYVLNNDSGGPVVVDLASGTPTIRLVGLQSDVDSVSPSGLDVSPLTDGWLLLNTGTGDVNFLDRDNLVLGPASGLNLPGATAFAARVVDDGTEAFVIRGNGTASDVVEVNRDNVALAAQLASDSTPVHVNAATAPPILSAPGDAAATHGDLYAIAQDAGTNGDELLSFKSVGGKHPSLLMKGLGSVAANGALATNRATGQVVLANGVGIRTVSLDGEGATANLVVHGPVDSIVPVTGDGATQWFLYREGGAWREVGFDTVTQHIVADRSVTGLSAPYVVSPVSTGGQLYAMSSSSAPGPNNKERSALFSMTLSTAIAHPITVASGTSGAYPEVSAEQPTYWNQSVIVAGPRVIFNNPDSELAVMIFNNGAIKVIDKFAATSVDPSSVLAGLIQQHPNTPQSKQPPQSPTPAPQQVDQSQSCKSSTESPHVPTIQPLQPGANSVLVQWNYPLLDAEDCQPSSYEVNVTPQNGADAPQNNPFFINNAATQFQVTGLESQSQYEVVVTAFINKQSTSSLPAFFTTAAGAPASPTKVTTQADGSGWSVSWTPCSGSHCGNPLAFWDVTSTPCGSSVAINPPAASGLSGTQTGVHIPFSSAAPPGTSLSFSVAPGGSDGSTGTPTNDGQCTEGWSPPDPSQLTLSVLYPNPNSNQVVLSVTPPPSAGTQSIYGSADTQFSFSLTDTTNPSGTQHPPPTSSASQTLSIITGDAYTADVTVTPTVHPSAAVTLPAKPVIYNSPWPSDLALSATAANGPTYDAGSGATTMTATVTAADAFGNNPNAKPLNLAASGSVDCANTVSAIASAQVTPAGAGSTNGTFTVSYPQPMNGTTIVDCSITDLTLAETDSSNVHTATSSALSSPAFPSGDEAFSASFDVPTGSSLPDGISVAIGGTGSLGATATLGGSIAPSGAMNANGCGDMEPVVNNSVIGKQCVKSLQNYANKNGVAVTWSPSLVVSWGASFSEGVPVPCGGGCPTFNSTAPTVTGVSPSSGASGATVTITGTNFASGATVAFGLTDATSVTFDSSTQLSADAPTGTGTVDVVVTVGGLSSATSSSDQFTYSTSSGGAIRPAGADIGFALAGISSHPILGGRQRHEAASPGSAAAESTWGSRAASMFFDTHDKTDKETT